MVCLRRLAPSTLRQARRPFARPLAGQKDRSDRGAPSHRRLIVMQAGYGNRIFWIFVTLIPNLPTTPTELPNIDGSDEKGGKHNATSEDSTTAHSQTPIADTAPSHRPSRPPNTFSRATWIKEKRPRRGDGASSGFLLGGTMMGEGKTPSDVYSIAFPTEVSIIKNRQFSALFDAG